MTLYLQRHQIREDGLGADIKLTKDGLKNAKTITLKKLVDEKIDIIYSSPFLRTLQTVSPYAKKTEKVIKIENGFIDILLKKHFKKGDKLYADSKMRNNHNIYKIKQENSIVSTEDMGKRINEDKDDLNERIEYIMPLFMKKIKKYIENGKNVVIVSHCGVILEIMRFFDIPTFTKFVKMGDLIKIDKKKLDYYYFTNK
jgi:broad specificity phosphatase PhoE